MRIIKLDAIDSTNTFLKQLGTVEDLKDYTIATAKFQSMGRGQMGTAWQSQSGKNLMFSVFKNVSFLPSDHVFFLGIVTALAVAKTLKEFKIPKLKIKWPNDILSEGKKVCGVLIENVVSNNKLKGTVIGIGLNVNQTEFDSLPQASSLLIISGKLHDLDELLVSIINNLRHYFSLLKNEKYEVLHSKYEQLLFRKGKASTFRDENGALFTGIIQGVSQAGNLKILLEDNVHREFDLKQVSLLY